MPAPTQPCPIPRCALEWYIAAQAIVAGISIWWSGDPRLGHYDIAFLGLHIPMDSLRWALALGLVGVAQMAAISIAPSAPQRWIAGIACFAWAALALSMLHGGMVAYGFGSAVLAAFGQLYVCAMFRGARWKA
jgi:hypothetical protein